MSSFKKGFVIGSVAVLLITPFTYTILKTVGKEMNKESDTKNTKGAI